MSPEALPSVSRHEVGDDDARFTLLVIAVPAPPPAEDPPPDKADPAPGHPLPVSLSWRANRRVDLCRP